VHEALARDRGVHAVGQAVHDVFGDLLADVADEQGDCHARDRIAQPETEGDGHCDVWRVQTWGADERAN
jgi:hypothetical protein